MDKREDIIEEQLANPGAERIILANCINNTKWIIECDAKNISPKHFSVEINKIIYMCIMYLFTSNLAIDVISIFNTIKDEKAKKLLEDVGGMDYIMLLEQSPLTQNIDTFINDLMQCYTKKLIYITCNDLKNEMMKADERSVTEILSVTQNKLNDIVLNATMKESTYKFGSKLKERLEKAKNNKGQIYGLTSGFDKYDKLTNGAVGGDLTIICAEAKLGKSVLLMNMAKHIAIDLSLPVLYIDTEQSNEEQEFRLLSIVSHVPESELYTGMYTEDTMAGTAEEKIKRVDEANAFIESKNFFHEFMPDFTVEKVQSLTRKFYLQHGIVALFFDYINFNPMLLSQNKNLRDDLILTNLTIGLKDMAGILEIPVFTAAQENRSGYGSEKKSASNIGGSIGILQKASKLLFLRNKTDDEISCDGVNGGNQKLIIQYQRHGDCGDNVAINIRYDKPYLTMSEAKVQT